MIAAGKLAFGLAIGLLIAAPAEAAGAEPAIVREGPASLASSHEYVLSSVHSKRDFLVQIAAPVRPPKPGEKVAIVYVLDGDYMFGMAADVARNLQIVREIAPVYIVAIGYPGDDHGEWVTGRLRDMLPAIEVHGDRIGGGGDAFKLFLTRELRPFIEARYPVDPNRSYLYGHSLGGLLAADFLATEPGAYAGYAVGSPALWVRPDLLETIRNRPAASGAAKPRVYVGVGGEEHDEDMIGWAGKLADLLRASGFDMAHRIFAGETHVSVEGVLFANAMKFLIPEKPAT